MTTKTRKPKTVPPQLYKGAETCDLVPEWVDTDAELLALLKTCHAADPDDLTPQLVLADWLAEHDDPREKWVRVGCDLWGQAGRLKPGKDDWDYEKAKAVLSPVCAEPTGWRLANIWGCLVAWHAPVGDGSGRVMGHTWVDARVKVVQRCLWWWGLGFLRQADAAGRQADAAGRQAYAAGRQAYAAWSQAYAAGSQAYAAWSQADAAWSQAYAAGSQAYAAWSQADAAWRQADAAWSQAYAAWRQADAAGRQADAAGRQKAVWRFARSAWELCVARLPELK